MVRREYIAASSRFLTPILFGSPRWKSQGWCVETEKALTKLNLARAKTAANPPKPVPKKVT